MQAPFLPLTALELHAIRLLTRNADSPTTQGVYGLMANTIRRRDPIRFDGVYRFCEREQRSAIRKHSFGVPSFKAIGVQKSYTFADASVRAQRTIDAHNQALHDHQG